ncbi:hypothetical protein [Halobacillus litoralis]|uniref:hypothetical protein n=1 Tax=Halobacillus litoralis TaxID=45668 RepID=UPI001CD28BFB|nr:hypothetical protein [Halobacillus litoralis]MCA1021561.1 hypothetical protein [Halobacillus litoralis]
MKEITFRGKPIQVFDNTEKITYTTNDLIYKLEEDHEGKYLLDIVSFGLIIPSDLRNRILAKIMCTKENDIPRNDELDGVSIATIVTRKDKYITVEEKDQLLDTLK